MRCLYGPKDLGDLSTAFSRTSNRNREAETDNDDDDNDDNDDDNNNDRNNRYDGHGLSMGYYSHF